ncbi:hypothetical protein [Frigoriglobus tundricola]|uniref:RedB protein n=1 Tax=Frigoriglobus tundricola TaxID=2774151 RepID=A0A6M5Z323_9BACT|nr:hypothetical protein [Frigoriglobus tundricola]QJX00818.1 hypothetical protein FTUN_8456 [Frigoriglobus tundricola]
MPGREFAVWATGFIWLAAVVTGFWFWERYDSTPGGTGETALAAVATAGDRWRLTVFVHPRCPCTRATLCEVAGLATARPELAVRVWIVCPPNSPDGWDRGEVGDLARHISGADVARDTDGAEALRFGARTSGHTVLATPGGAIVFSGGVTAARGRTGENVGLGAVRAWLEGRTGAAGAPVFGCDLFTPGD